MNSEEFAENANGLCAATLCADSETVDAVKQAVARKNGTFAGELEDYACDTRNPQLVQKLQRAEICFVSSTLTATGKPRWGRRTPCSRPCMAAAA